MKLYKSFYIIIGCVAAFCCSCKEESLTAEVPEIENALMMGKPQFVLPGAENNITHRLSGEEMVFELRQGKTVIRILWLSLKLRMKSWPI